eukprot:SM003474S13023  [mRNA]  locus=s3474:123:1332:- [translate_table: standard]
MAACLERLTEGSSGAVVAGLAIAEPLSTTGLVAVVGAGEQPDLSPRRLSLVDTSERATAATTAEIGFASSVLGVRANRTRLAVVLEVRVHVFDLARLEAPFATIDTAANPRGLCALSDSSSTGLCYLATPAGLHSGSVLIHDALEAQALCQVRSAARP